MAPALCAASPALTMVADLASAAAHARREKTEAALRARQADFAAFEHWCGRREMSALPATPVPVAAFLAAEAGVAGSPS